MKIVLLSTLLLLLNACGGEEEEQLPPPTIKLAEISQTLRSSEQEQTPVPTPLPLKSDKLLAFESNDGFLAYVARLEDAQKDELEKSCPTCIDGPGAPGSAPVNAAPPSGAEDEDGITNNQEVGVDEGGIIKAVGDRLIVLRRGRLFSILTKNGEADTLELTDTVDAFPPTHSTHTWYDELLIYENKIIVVGYSYGYGATEIGHFTLEEDGTISHQATNFLRSNDYYSSRNFASRLIGSKLVFYMPFDFHNRYDEANRIILPGQSQLLSSGQLSDWRNIVDATSIVQPIEDTLNPVLHTIAICDLSVDSLPCTANSVLGPHARTFYVSPQAVFLWTASEEGSTVYRLPLDGSAATASLAKGAPTDQFSFKELADGTLNVLLRDSGHGDGMWAPEFRDGGVAFLSIRPSQFSDAPVRVSESAYVILPSAKGYQMQNRFIGNTVLYGSQKGWSDEPADANAEVYAYHWKSNIMNTLVLEHDVQRIEALGNNAIVIGSRGTDLLFTSIDIVNRPQKVDTYTLPNSVQGEHRSHGFFYKPTTETTGVLGLPTRTESSESSELTETSASVIYLSVQDNQLTELGALTSSPRTDFDDNCRASCVDWYGNSRPIFFKDRVLALLGYDLVEGRLENGLIVEGRRLDYSPQPR